jgi:hypothetical protein
VVLNKVCIEKQLSRHQQQTQNKTTINDDIENGSSGSQQGGHE